MKEEDGFETDEISYEELEQFIREILDEEGDGPTNTANPELIGGFTADRGFMSDAARKKWKKRNAEQD